MDVVVDVDGFFKPSAAGIQVTRQPRFCNGFFVHDHATSTTTYKLMNQIGTETKHQESKNYAALGVPPADASYSQRSCMFHHLCLLLGMMMQCHRKSRATRHGPRIQFDECTDKKQLPKRRNHFRAAWP